MPTTDLLKTFGLQRNPFTDRTAEKTNHDATSLYIHSDLRGFKPNETTYVFFGRRGSGKTTIRLQLEEAYRSFNAAAVASGRSKGHFWVDLCKPGHMTACLTTFQETIKAGTDNWDASFSDQWTTADMVDCILSYSATLLMGKLTAGNEESRTMLAALRGNEKAVRQFLLLAHLYSRTDVAGLREVRTALLRPRMSTAQVAASVGVGLTTLVGLVAASKDARVSGAVTDASDASFERVADALPFVRHHPRAVGAAISATALGGALYYSRWQRRRLSDRAAALQRNIRVVRAQPTELLAGWLGSAFGMQDSVDTIRQLCIGVSAHQKLDLLQSLVQLLGYEGLVVFGDCFDEVTLLDPVRYPGSIKAFAREVCRNDILNFGRLHFFFPDSRLSLDLNTDKTLKEARFDRHFVRDLTWSRHQLEELAERRFRAAQQALREESAGFGSSCAVPGMAFPPDLATTSFADLFKKVRGEDFSSYLSKLSTPRELMIMMTEMFARIEANPEGGLTSQDMEIAVTKALEQSV